MVAARFVEEAFVKVRRVPALGADHKCGDVGEAGLQGDDHQVTHHTDVFAARQMGLGRFGELHFCQLAFHSLKAVDLFLDGSNGVKIFAELLLIRLAKLTLE